MNVKNVMSREYTVPWFESTAFWTWVISHNHLTRAPTKGPILCLLLHRWDSQPLPLKVGQTFKLQIVDIQQKWLQRGNKETWKGGGGCTKQTLTFNSELFFIQSKFFHKQLFAAQAVTWAREHSPTPLEEVPIPVWLVSSLTRLDLTKKYNMLLFECT